MAMEKYIFINEEFALGVCRVCESGIRGDIIRHFTRNHGTTWKAHGKELKSYIKTLDCADFREISTLYPDASTVREPVPGIAIYDGWICAYQSCTHLSINKDTMRQHCKEAHDWTLEEEAEHYYSCRLQTLFPRPNLREGVHYSRLAYN
jgi:Orsellinic acid/F9775 biosynthesis cluster protein D